MRQQIINVTTTTHVIVAQEERSSDGEKVCGACVLVVILGVILAGLIYYLPIFFAYCWDNHPGYTILAGIFFGLCLIGGISEGIKGKQR